MSNPIQVLAWAIIAVALAGEIMVAAGEEVPGDIGPLAIIAAGYLFGHAGSQIIRKNGQ
jgi:hypothetical protein